MKSPSTRPRTQNPPGTEGLAPLPTIEPTLSEQLDTAGLLGLNHDPRRDCPSIRQCAAQARGKWLLVIADAFDLPWVPYHQQNHTDHSFAVRSAEGGRIDLLDAYTNYTPWGPARPRTWTITPAVLDDLLPAGPLTVVPLFGGPTEEPGPAAAAAAAADLVRADRDGVIDAYADAYAGHPDPAVSLGQLTVETWLLARQRLAHARWLDQVASGDILELDAGPALAHAERWSEVSEGTYVAMRRARRGRAAPEGVVARVADLLRQDGRVLQECANRVEVRT
jgi:hypothetical protein